MNLMPASTSYNEAFAQTIGVEMTLAFLESTVPEMMKAPFIKYATGSIRCDCIVSYRVYE